MNGVLLVNKEKGVTSRDVVNEVGHILGTKKIGHTGTLDPMATGVLVLCIGSSLKLVESMMNHDKEYIATILLGIETDTLDITGEVQREVVPQNITKERVVEVLKKFQGKIKQEVPKYSAIKVGGKKLYEYARAGIDVSLPVHEVEISQIELVGDVLNNTFQIHVTVSKGTYIRSLVRDIGYALGTVAVMTDLVRTRVGKFLIEDAFSISDIKAGSYALLDPREVLDLPVIMVDDFLLKKIKNGFVLPSFFSYDMVFIENSNHELVAIYQQKGDGLVKPYRMF
mgnify:FL=1